jgi:glycerophosphoryl diester phosphodiesterase
MPAVRRPLVIAHRGASRAATENTEAAFEAAIALRADMVEFDVRRTRDDRLIAYHDPAIGPRRIDELTHAQITQARGYRPPLLDEVLALATGRIGLDVELKEDGYVDRVLGAVRDAFGPDRVMITSFLDGVVEQAAYAWPEAPAGLLASESGGDDSRPARLRERAAACGATAVALEHALVRRDGIDWARRADLDVYVWTVNEDDSLRALLRDERMAGVITDVPDRAVALHPAEGEPAP